MVTGHRHINSVVSRHWVVGTPKARVLKRPFTRIRAQRLNFGVDTRIACVAGFRRGGKRKRRASEAREDRTREDHGTFSLPRSFWLSSLPFYGLPRRLIVEKKTCFHCCPTRIVLWHCAQATSMNTTSEGKVRYVPLRALVRGTRLREPCDFIIALQNSHNDATKLFHCLQFR